MEVIKIKYFTDKRTQLDNIFKKPLTEENRVKAAEIAAQMQISQLLFLSALTNKE